MTPSNFELAANEPIGYTIRMENCKSGLTATATDKNPYLNAYLLDRSCIAKLSSIQFRNLTWTLSTKQPFSTYKAGDKGTFIANNNDNNQLQVTVVKQLNDPVAKTDTVSYSFVTKFLGNDGAITDFKITAQTSVLGPKSAAFVLRSAQLLTLTDSGAGQFYFAFECEDAITKNERSQLSCQETPLDQIRYLLIQDPLDHAVSFEELETLFANRTGIFSVEAPDDVLRPNRLYPHGGFRTKQGAAAILGPEPLLDTQYLLLIVANGGSFQLFKIQVNLR